MNRGLYITPVLFKLEVNFVALVPSAKITTHLLSFLFKATDSRFFQTSRVTSQIPSPMMETIGLNSLGLLILLLASTTLLSIALYRLFLSPLSHLPGPPLWAISRLPYAYHVCVGRIIYTIASLHDIYGPVVRVAPNEISFITPEAWNDIYGTIKGDAGGKSQMRKDPDLFFRPSEGSHDMTFELDDGEHARQRLDSPSFHPSLISE